MEHSEHEAFEAEKFQQIIRTKWFAYRRKKRQLTVAVVSPSLGNVRVDELSLLPDVYSLL